MLASFMHMCALLKRSMYFNRTVSSPVITGLLTVLLEYIDLSAEMQPLTVLVSLLHQQTFTLTYCLACATPELVLLACNIARKNFMRKIGNDKSIK